MEISYRQQKTVGALFTEFAKAFNYLSNYLLIAKLNAYGFSFEALRLVHYYL